MRQILSLLRRRKPRHFALLDEYGRCRMLLSSTHRPAVQHGSKSRRLA
jgi:hypothetical protein